jgi:phosphoglycolate phosphatase-like HAD superfamily hydrolase
MTAPTPTTPASQSPRDIRFDWLSCDAYLFDIDGTILRSRDRIHYNAMNRAMLEVYGKDTTIARVAYHGMTDLGIMRAALALEGIPSDEFDQKLPQALDCIRKGVERNLASLNPQICDGIPQALKALEDSAKLLGVASGNLESVGWHKIAATGLRDHFLFGAFADRHEQRAEVFAYGVEQARTRLGSGAKICFFGDTPEDVRAAQKVGARIVSVCTGVYKREDLAPLQPDICVQSCIELPSLVPADTPPLRQ